MALTSQIDPGSGLPSDCFRWYFENAGSDGKPDNGTSNPGQVSVLRGMGLNRMSLESAGAFVHIAQTARYEWEGLGSARLAFVGFEAASAAGKPIDFNNYGQTPSRASPIVSFSAQAASDKVASFGTTTGSAWTENAYIDGAGNGDFNGRLNAARLCTDSYTVATLPSSPQAGDRAYVTDANSPTWGATVAGSGSTKCPVTHDGTNWKVG
jgi:hypothetical protein